MMLLITLFVASLSLANGQSIDRPDPQILKAVDSMNAVLDRSVNSLSLTAADEDEKSEIIAAVQDLKSNLLSEAPDVLQKNLEEFRNALALQGDLSPNDEQKLRVSYAAKAIQELQTTLMSNLVSGNQLGLLKR
jgi:hypothetical protein